MTGGQLLLDGSDVAIERATTQVERLQDALIRIGHELDVVGDPVIVLDAVRDIVKERARLRRECSILRSETTKGSRTCRTCRWFVPRCENGQQWARRGTGCTAWEE